MCLSDSPHARKARAAERGRGPATNGTAASYAVHPLPMLIGGMLLGAAVARVIKATGARPHREAP